MNRRTPYDTATLLYRRQFILGPSYVSTFSSWKTIRVRDTICITAHPQLNTHQSVRYNKSVTLLGYILDPDNAEASDSDIVDRLLDDCLRDGGFEKIVKSTEGMGGRWILIVDDGTLVKLFTDPMGLRQVHYTNTSFSGPMWCATQPGLLAEVLQLGLDDDQRKGYLESYVKDWSQRQRFCGWPCLWPGDTTPYRQVSHLLPNHYLDLNTRLSHRFWPDKALSEYSLEKAVENGSHILAGLIKSADRRFALAMSFSAGWDSRVLLAASKDTCDRMYFYTYRHGPHSPDTVVPPRLLSRLGLECNLVRYPARMSKEFEAIYNRNVTIPHDYTGRINQALYHQFPANRVGITGNAAEITRARFRLAVGEELTARKLARLTYFGSYGDQLEQSAYVVKAWERWLGGLVNIHNVHPLDLFYWEHFGGNFAAMDQSELDIVHETLTPYNCRTFLVKMLSVDEKYRDHDEPIHYRMMIRNLWPEVLSEPVNPPEKKSVLLVYTRRLKKTLVSVLTEALKKVGLFRAAREIYRTARHKRVRGFS